MNDGKPKVPEGTEASDKLLFTSLGNVGEEGMGVWEPPDATADDPNNIDKAPH